MLQTDTYYRAEIVSAHMTTAAESDTLILNLECQTETGEKAWKALFITAANSKEVKTVFSVLGIADSAVCEEWDGFCESPLTYIPNRSVSIKTDREPDKTGRVAVRWINSPRKAADPEKLKRGRATLAGIFGKQAGAEAGRVASDDDYPF